MYFVGGQYRQQIAYNEATLENAHASVARGGGATAARQPSGAPSRWPAAGRWPTRPRGRGSSAPDEGRRGDPARSVIVYGRNPLRESLRGPREVRRVWATERAAAEPWLG